MTRPCRVPPTPEVMAALYAEYVRIARPLGLSFRQFLVLKGYGNPAEFRVGMDDAARARSAGGVELVSVPSRPVTGRLRVQVLLVDFPDLEGTLPVSHYQDLLFSKGVLPIGSMRDYYLEVSLGKVDVTGSVHGWLRLPQRYSYYTNNSSGTDETYPRNAQGMAEHAVRAALAAGVPFERELDLMGDGTVTALFIVHAGLGAESLRSPAREQNIWSHKWSLPTSLQVAAGLTASVYLTVPNNARVGVCSHELGHLAFQWEDFYDPNYDRDGSYWDGSGDWDLMAGGSHNESGNRPAHPAGLHKAQHGWVEVLEVRSTARVALDPYTPTSGKLAKVVSPKYLPGQYLILENRARRGFDASVPGEGLLVWRVDESAEMYKPDQPALMLIQADGRHDLERADDWNSGDAGDPFPGSAARTELSDAGDTSTTFPGADSSGVLLRNIVRDPTTGRITLDVQIGAAGPPPASGDVVTGEISPDLRIPDHAPAGVSSILRMQGSGTVQDLAVEVGIDHSYIGDLQVELVAPSGLAASLHNREGGAQHNLSRIYRSSETPSLAGLAGAPVAGDWTLRISDRARADEGVLRKWGLAITPRRSPTKFHETRTPRVTIPDNNPAGISDGLVAPLGGVVRSVSVALDIVHPFRGDLRVELVGPQGERALLHNREGGGAANLKTAFSSAGTAALAAFVGKPARGDWALRVSDVASRDEGVLNEWTLDLDLAAGVQQVRGEAAPNLAIPDNAPGGVGSSISIAPAGAAQSVELKASIVHPYIGDLRVELVAPSGARAVLHDRTGGRTRDLALDLRSGTSEALALLVGQPIQGPWVLRIADLEAADTGKLASWSLALAYTG